MRKIIKMILCMALCAVTLLSLCACGNNNDPQNTTRHWKHNVVGTWKHVSDNGEDYDIYKFFSDGSGQEEYTYRKNGKIAIQQKDFTWKTHEPNIIEILIDGAYSSFEVTYHETYLRDDQPYYIQCCYFYKQ